MEEKDTETWSCRLQKLRVLVAIDLKEKKKKKQRTKTKIYLDKIPEL